jgi:hypothetical protein
MAILGLLGSAFQDSLAGAGGFIKQKAIKIPWISRVF